MSTSHHATQKIILLATVNPKNNALPILVDFVSRFGNNVDARLLYELFEKTKDPILLDPIMFHGDMRIANQLFANAIRGGKLDPAYPNEVLLALAYLQAPEMQAVLMDYYCDLFSKNDDWDLHFNVCMALLNYDCSYYEKEVREVIDNCLNVHLFPDLLPIIAHQLKDEELNEKLVQHALKVASTSCVSGILFNTAMAGETYRERFKSMILDKSLEATYSGIGNTFFTCMGMHVQRITIAELYEEFLVKLKQGDEGIEDYLNVLYDLMEAKLREPVKYGIRSFEKHSESIDSLNGLFFAWKSNPNKDETIFGLISDYAKKNAEFNADWHKEKWYNLQDQYQWKIANEVILELIGNR